MIVAGFGFSKSADVASLAAALRATGASGVTHFATVEEKAESAALKDLAETMGLVIQPIVADALPSASVETQSERSKRIFGTGSLSEAVALLGAGRNARLVVARVISPDRQSTCAIAEGEGI